MRNSFVFANSHGLTGTDNQIVTQLISSGVRPGQDNHYWDCLVGCAVGASILGAGQEMQGKRQIAEGHKPSKRLTYAEIQAKRRAG